MHNQYNIVKLAQLSAQRSSVTARPPGLPGLSPAGPSALRPIMGTNTCGCPIKPTNLPWRIDTSTFTPKCLSPHLSAGLGLAKISLHPLLTFSGFGPAKIPFISRPPWPSWQRHGLLDVVRSKDAAHHDIEQLLVHLDWKMWWKLFFENGSRHHHHYHQGSQLASPFTALSVKVF